MLLEYMTLRGCRMVDKVLSIEECRKIAEPYATPFKLLDKEPRRAPGAWMFWINPGTPAAIGCSPIVVDEKTGEVTRLNAPYPFWPEWAKNQNKLLAS